MSERIAYDEFGLFHENAHEYGLPFDGPPAVRRMSVEVESGRSLSALVWGDRPAEYVFLHGGAQNAHTWDTVLMALGRLAVAIDLPGHGHSDQAGTGIGPEHNARDVAQVVRRLAPDAGTVVGMSLGGLTSISLAAQHPELVRSLVLVDVTPGVDGHKARAITAFVNGPKTFPSFEELLARTIEHNPTRTVSSLRRGILHNAVQQADGSWVWRYRRFEAPTAFEQQPAAPDQSAAPDQDPLRSGYARLWDAISELTVPLMLVRGMLPQSVVDDADEAELRRRLPGVRIEHIADAGHSVQGDTPLELAALIAEFSGRGGPASAG